MITVVAAVIGLVVAATTVIVLWRRAGAAARLRRRVIEAHLIARAQTRELERWAEHERRRAIERARAARGRPAHRASR